MGAFHVLAENRVRPFDQNLWRQLTFIYCLRAELNKERGWSIFCWNILGVPQGQFPMVKRSSFLSNDLWWPRLRIWTEILWLKSCSYLNGFQTIDWDECQRQALRSRISEGRPGEGPHDEGYRSSYLKTHGHCLAGMLSFRLTLLGRLLVLTGSAFSAVAELYLEHGDFLQVISRTVSVSWSISKLTHDLNSEPTFRKVLLDHILVAQHPKLRPFLLNAILESMIQTSGLCRAHSSSFTVWPRVEEATSLGMWRRSGKGTFGVTSDSTDFAPVQPLVNGDSSTFMLQILNWAKLC